MSKESYFLLGLFFVLAVVLISKIIAIVGFKKADKDAKKELFLQKKEMLNRRKDFYLRLKIEKLEELYKTLSKFSFENFKTINYAKHDPNSEISNFRDIYIKNCELLHAAEAIVSLYFPQMRETLKNIYEKYVILLGLQNAVVCTEIKTISDTAQDLMEKVLKKHEELKKNLGLEK